MKRKLFKNITLKGVSFAVLGLLFLGCTENEPHKSQPLNTAITNQPEGYGDWSISHFQENGYYRNDGQQICYTMSNAIQQTGGSSPRNGYVMIKHHMGEKGLYMFFYTAGYRFYARSRATLHIGKLRFDLTAVGDTATTHRAAIDRKIAIALSKRMGTFYIQGKNFDGAEITEYFSARGTNNAFKAIDKACGVTGRQSINP
jgi:hypothetical protein